jgi:membrane-associated phospholipid phosphatase
MMEKSQEKATRGVAGKKSGEAGEKGKSRIILLKGMTFFGSSIFYLLTTAGSLFLKIQVFLELALAYVIIMAATSAIKLFFFRERPARQEYRNIIEQIDASSFPSAHTARAFAFAGVLGFYGLNYSKLIMAGLLLLACAVAYSRVSLKKHHISDVIFGSLLGILSAIAAFIV